MVLANNMNQLPLICKLLVQWGKNMFTKYVPSNGYVLESSSNLHV